MRQLAAFLIALLLALPAAADMFPDASNAVQPGALNNIGKVAGSFYGPAYGTCTWSAAGDVGPCVNAALTAAAAAGGGTVSLPPGSYGLSTKIVWPTNGAPVGLHCPAGVGAGKATTLKWLGTVGGRMAEVKTVTGQINGAELKNCAFDGNLGRAAEGLYVASSYHGHFDDLTFTGGFSGGNVVTLTADAAAASGSQQNTLDNLYIDNGTNWGGTFPYTSTQLKLGAFIDGTGVHGNAAFNFARNIFIGGSAGTGLLCEGCDNNHISGRIFNSGTSVDMTVAVSGSHMFPANGNQFAPFGYSGSYIARGQTTFPTCAPYSSCTYNNFVDIDQTNGNLAPTQEPGADLHWGSNSGYRSGFSLIGIGNRQAALVAAAGYTLWGACVNNSAGLTNVLYLCDSDNTPFVVFDGLTGSKFSIDNTGGGTTRNLRFNRLAGTGIFEFSDTVQLDNGALPPAYQAGQFGTQTLPFSSVWSRYFAVSNSGHTWSLDLGLTTGSATADAKFTLDGVSILTLGGDQVTRVKYLAPDPSSPVNGTTGCTPGMITSDASFVYICATTDTWKRAALTAY